MADQRVFTRVPFVESLTWEDMTGNQGAAEVQNVGRGGIGLISSSYLRPGPMVNLLFESVEFDDRPIELQALVSWCNPHGRQSNSFLVGLSWVHGEQRTLPTVNEVFLFGHTPAGRVQSHRRQLISGHSTIGTCRSFTQ